MAGDSHTALGFIGESPSEKAGSHWVRAAGPASNSWHVATQSLRGKITNSSNFYCKNSNEDAANMNKKSLGYCVFSVEAAESSGTPKVIAES